MDTIKTILKSALCVIVFTILYLICVAFGWGVTVLFNKFTEKIFPDGGWGFTI